MFSLIAGFSAWYVTIHFFLSNWEANNPQHNKVHLMNFQAEDLRNAGSQSFSAGPVTPITLFLC